MLTSLSKVKVVATADVSAVISVILTDDGPGGCSKIRSHQRQCARQTPLTSFPFHI